MNKKAPRIMNTVVTSTFSVSRETNMIGAGAMAAAAMAAMEKVLPSIERRVLSWRAVWAFTWIKTAAIPAMTAAIIVIRRKSDVSGAGPRSLAESPINVIDRAKLVEPRKTMVLRFLESLFIKYNPIKSPAMTGTIRK